MHAKITTVMTRCHCLTHLNQCSHVCAAANGFVAFTALDMLVFIVVRSR